MSNKVRVRFAPSPTGLPHLGNLRTALFNWLFAKQQDGDFILRFEDTDRTRLVSEAEKYIEDSLKWLRLEWNEGVDVGGKYGPYRQSERLEIYNQYAEQLLKEGKMYRDWTSTEELEKMRQSAIKAKKPFLVRAEMLKTEGNLKHPHVLRFRINESLKLDWRDEVFGKMAFASHQIDDFVAIKSDGFPTYNFANVIDDHTMAISHIIRGEEFISSTPKYLQVYHALGWESPQTIHVPPVLGPDKTKLSKRHGALPALEYQKLGYLPEAVINFLAFLGWHPGSENEVFTRDQLVESFSLQGINKSPAIFDINKLRWINGQHIQMLTANELLDYSFGFWPKGHESNKTELKKRILEISKDRLKTMADLRSQTDFFFTFNPLSENRIRKIAKEFNKITLKDWLYEVISFVKETPFEGDSIHPRAHLSSQIQTRVTQLGLPGSILLGSLRDILTGSDQTPPVWDIIYVLGKNETIRRLDGAAAIL